MIRTLLVALLLAAPAFAEEDPIRTTLDAAKKKYELGIRAMNSKVAEAFEARDGKIRKSDKPSTDLIAVLKGEQERFKEYNELPSWIPPALATEQKKLRAEMEEAYKLAVKNYVKDKQDDKATKADKELDEFWASLWTHMNIEQGRIKDGAVRIPKGKEISTKAVFTGPIEIILVAKTEAEDIRIHAYNHARLIFNWQNNKRELRICRPDGDWKTGQDGSLATAKVTPLEPDKWHTLRWQIHNKGMSVYANDRLVFSEKRPYKTEDMSSVIIIRGHDSILDVKELKIKSLLPLE